MNKLRSLLLACLAVIILAGCTKSTPPTDKQVIEEALLDRESKSSFDFFWREANTDPASKGYGLIRDRAPGNPGLSSTASVGFGLTAIAIGAERGWISKKEAEQRALGTLKTLWLNAGHKNGVFYHFLQMDNAKSASGSEVSIIDTAIALNGAITAGEYFGGETKKFAEQIYARVNWEWFRDPGRNMFYMAYRPNDGFQGHWDFYAEQLMLYLLAAGSPSHPVQSNLFYSFTRHNGSYGNGEKFIHSWFGSIFTYQYSHAWFDLRGTVDRQGVDWWANSINASLANRQFSIDQSQAFKTFGPNAWGITASDSPHGYEGRYGAAPSGFGNDQHWADGTLAPAGALGSIVFTPEQSIAALKHFYTHPELIGDYGLKDAYNTAVTPAWFDPDVIGIDKGITLLMIENYRSGFVWQWFMQNQYVQKGMKQVGLKN